ncbi:turripeptide Pal9.2-like [Periplaneta americana]|uniref:turripeptide Pal9.2-like n=1 Tax=Periplaneta americana TaxID=6978 RepID=UPI0037E98C30
MDRVLCAVFVVSLAVALTHAQLGSVHCKVGCACSEEAQPLCGNDHVTYLNECKLRCAQCNKHGLVALFHGRCENAVFAYPAPIVTLAAPPIQYAYVPAPIRVSP